MTAAGRPGAAPGGASPASLHEHDAWQAAHAAALAALPGMGPATLAAVLAARTPAEAWEEVRAGRIERPPSRRPPRVAGDADGHPSLFAASPRPTAGHRSSPAPRRSWADVARRVHPAEWWAPAAAAGVRVTWWGGPGYPPRLSSDPEPPGVLFWRGDLGALDRLCVAVVGTRHATRDGRATAYQMGRDLAAAGVCVVSGLALGIDGAAHAGAVAAAGGGAPGSTVGVAASGVDVPYPRRHWTLWREVASTGAIISENVPGRPAQAWRFPSRNRVIAGLCQMVVVVESPMTGGSLITAEAAIERGIEVRVVPGPVHSPASEGSNQLLYDGPGPVRHARDVLDALGVFRPDPPAAGGGTTDPGRRRRPAPTAAGGPGGPGGDPAADRVLDAIGWRPASTGQIMARSGLDAAATDAALDRLVAAGRIAADGGWWERIADR